MIHHLKCWPEFFEAIRTKRKTFEIRQDDRGFMLGDQLCNQEWDNELGMATGRYLLTAPITYIMRGPAFGLAKGYVIMSITVEAVLESGAGEPQLNRQGVEEFIERSRQVRAFRGTLNKTTSHQR